MIISNGAYQLDYDEVGARLNNEKVVFLSGFEF